MKSYSHIDTNSVRCKNTDKNQEENPNNNFMIEKENDAHYLDKKEENDDYYLNEKEEDTIYQSNILTKCETYNSQPLEEIQKNIDKRFFQVSFIKNFENFNEKEFFHGEEYEKYDEYKVYSRRIFTEIINKKERKYVYIIYIINESNYYVVKTIYKDKFFSKIKNCSCPFCKKSLVFSLVYIFSSRIQEGCLKYGEGLHNPENLNVDNNLYFKYFIIQSAVILILFYFFMKLIW